MKNTSQTNSSNELSADELVVALLPYRSLIIGIIVFFISISLVAALILPKIYRAEVVVIPVESNGALSGSQLLGSQLGGLASLANINLGNSSQKDEAVATLRSRKFTISFIEDMDIMPVLYHDDWDEDKKRWKRNVSDGAPTVWDAVEKFDQDIRHISENRQNGVLTFSIAWTDPELAAKWANSMVERVNRIIREQAVRDSEKSIEFLMRELDLTNIIEVRQGIYGLIEHHTQRKMLANVQEEYAFKVIDPAIPPDSDNFESPRRILLLLLGAIVGSVTGVFSALMLRFIMRARN